MGAKCCGVESGQIHLISKGNGDLDSTISDEEYVAQHAKSSMMYPNADVKDLQNSDIYSLVMKSSGSWSDTRWPRHWRPTLPNIVAKRELGVNKMQQFTHGEMCILNSRYLPNHSTQLKLYSNKAFCGIYSEDGNIFLTACQDQLIRVYNTTDDNFKLIKSIQAQDVGWSVLDTAFSPDGCFVAYSSWSDSVHLCSVYEDSEIHEALRFEPGNHRFCIFSLMFSSDNKEILGGANDGYLYVYDRETNKRTLKINAHDDDTNAVRFADSSSQILYSGGDDGLCKVWDRRTLRDKNPLPVGILAGHRDGITYIDSKGDARFLISNSKDQTLKLWDIRHFSDQSAIEETKRAVETQHWDYRWQRVPKRNSIFLFVYKTEHSKHHYHSPFWSIVEHNHRYSWPLLSSWLNKLISTVTKKRNLRGDSSVMTYRGHCILNTLIRCKFSPEANTGQRYIYTGCATGSVVVYDILTGKVESKLEGHSLCVRDVSWHPYKNIIISTSWDGKILEWTFVESSSESMDSWKKGVVKQMRLITRQRQAKR